MPLERSAMQEEDHKIVKYFHTLCFQKDEDALACVLLQVATRPESKELSHLKML